MLCGSAVQCGFHGTPCVSQVRAHAAVHQVCQQSCNQDEESGVQSEDACEGDESDSTGRNASDSPVGP